MSNGWEQLLTSNFTTGTCGNLLANLISSAAVEVYAEWSKKLHQRGVNARLTRVHETVDGMILTVKRQPPAVRQFTAFPPDNNSIATFYDFMRTNDFKVVVSEMVFECILSDSVGESTIRHTALVMRLHGLPDPIATVLVAKDLAQIVLLAVQRSRRDGTELGALRPISARRYLVETTEERILRRLNLLTQLVDVESKKLTNIESNLLKLRRSVASVHSTMRPPSLEKAKKVAIDKLYVGPRLITENGERFQLPGRLQRLLENSPRTVVLGNPGGGKTSLAGYLAYTISTLSNLDVDYATIPIVLREHAAEVGASGGLNLLRAAARTAYSKYQVEISEAEFEYLCLQGRVLMILDGLDEFLELDQRVAVAGAVEAFATLYPLCKIVVTSREVGYEMASISRTVAVHATLEPFDEYQVREYAGNWFQQTEELTYHARESLVSGFMAESDSIRDLRSNPLMLSLLCGLYRYHRYIPSNRPDLYEKCSNLLFDEWDKKRRLRPKFEFDAHVRPAIQHLALWIFTDQERQAGVPSEDLISEAARYFNDEWVQDDMAVAVSGARAFVDFCRNRAWVLTDTGTNASGTSLFQFTHRTFLEYFTALQLDRTLEDAELSAAVIEHCADGPWHIVCQILIQLAWKRRRGLADRIIEGVCTTAATLTSAQQAIADELCVRAVESTPLKANTVRLAVERAMEQFSLRLNDAPLRSQHPETPVSGREAFWIDSSKLAIVNYRAARPVVVRVLTDRLAHSTLPLREASHLIEFALTDECTPTDLRDAIPPEAVTLLTEFVLGRAPEAWIECSALLLQIDFKPSGHSGMLFGNRVAGRICSVQGMWGNRDLPNCVEIISWLLINNQLPVGSKIIERCDELARTALRQMKSMGSSRGYSPHPIWHAMQQVGPIDGSAALPVAPVLLLLSLVEHVVADCPSEDERRETLFQLVKQPWGRCDFVPYLIARRFHLTARFFEATLKKESERLRVDAWSSPDGPSAAQLASVLLP